MKRWQKTILVSIFILGFIGSIMLNMPAWLVGSLLSHYTQGRVATANEHGTFWNGKALLYAQDSMGKSAIPLLAIGWKIRLGFSKFIDIDFTVSDHTVAKADLTKAGLAVSNVDLSLSLDQLAPLMGNLNSLGLSGNVHVMTKQVVLNKKMQGNLNINLDNVGSSMAPLNPLGSYQVKVDLATNSLNIASNPDSVISISGAGNFSNLTLSTKVQDNKKDQLIQFVTMLGIPQPDGSYKLKVL